MNSNGSTLRPLGACVMAMLLIALAACVPQQRVSWSKDGTRALVAAGDGLHVMTSDGTLSNLLLPDVTAAEWIGPDTALVIRTLHVTTWADAQTMLAPNELRQVEAFGDYFVSRVPAAHGDAEKMKSMFENDPVLESAPNLLGFDLLYALHRDPDIKQYFPEPDLLDAGVATPELAVVQISADGARVLRRLAVGGEFLDMRLNARQDWVLFTQTRLGDRQTSLGVVPIAGGTITWLASGVAPLADWMPDGQTAVFIGGLGEPGNDKSSLQLAQVQQIKVLDEGGKINPSPSPKALLRVAVGDVSGVRALSDGRVLLTSVALKTLEAKAHDQQNLYVLEPADLGVQPVLLPKNKQSVAAFAVSDDGSAVAAVLSDNTIVMAQLSGRGPYHFTLVPESESNTYTMPAWREHQLTYVGRTGSQQQQLMMTNTASTAPATALSTQWPAAARVGWLDEKAPASAPAPDATTHAATTQPEQKP